MKMGFRLSGAHFHFRYSKNMLRVGLTGGIGSGKSAVASLLAEMGALVIDSDQLAREVVSPGSEGLHQIVDRFGSTIIKDGGLDRAALAAIVFKDDAARRDLEAITHPLIRKRFEQIVSQAPSDAIVVNEVPLLVERKMQGEFDVVITVVARDEIRRARLLARGMGSEEIEQRVKAQASDDERTAVSDVTIINDGQLADLRASVTTLWFERLKPYEEQRRMKAGRPAQ